MHFESIWHSKAARRLALRRQAVLPRFSRQFWRKQKPDRRRPPASCCLRRPADAKELSETRSTARSFPKRSCHDLDRATAANPLPNREARQTEGWSKNSSSAFQSPYSFSARG